MYDKRTSASDGDAGTVRTDRQFNNITYTENGQRQYQTIRPNCIAVYKL